MNTNSDQIKEIQANKQRLLDEIKALDEQETALTKYKGFKLGDWVHVKNYFTYQIAGFGEDSNGKIYAESKANSMVSAFYLHAINPATAQQIIKVLQSRAQKAGIVVGAKYIDIDYKDSTRIPVREIVSIEYGTKKEHFSGNHKSIYAMDFLEKNGWLISVRGNNGHVNPHDKLDIIKEEPLPKINGYEGTYDGEFFTYGCAKIDKQIIKDAYMMTTLKYAGNRTVTKVSITLDSGVTLTHEQIAELYQHTVEV